MSATIIQAQDCCTTCPSTGTSGSGSQGPAGPVGPQGPPGPQGNSGINGINSYSILQAAFNMPNPAGFATITVDDSLWMGINQPVFIENAGHMKVTNVIDPVTVTVQNLSVSGNAAPATQIPAQSKISPDGTVGATGPAGLPNSPVIVYTAAAGTPPANPPAGGLTVAVAVNTTDGGIFWWYSNAWH